MSSLQSTWNLRAKHSIPLWCWQYCWNNENINTIQKIQDKATRKITFSNLRDNVSIEYKNLNILKFNDLIHLQNCLLMHSFEKNTLPEALKNFSSYAFNDHNHNTRFVSLGLHHKPTVNTQRYGSFSLHNTCVDDWNNFKKLFPHLDTKLLSSYAIKKLFSNLVFQHYA